ncbi:hypothetical protein K438DRAFT_1782194 [Mycena galopus ATCC 62051]|nr:hypothetical protein K438DRAFT_1782194 [Mycena galopus ATCC 62051]
MDSQYTGCGRQNMRAVFFQGINVWGRKAQGGKAKDQNIYTLRKMEQRCSKTILQDRNKSKVEEYGRRLDEAMLDFSAAHISFKINLELSIHRLHVEFAAVERERHAAVLTVSRMSESERLLLTQIHGNYTHFNFKFKWGRYLNII